MSTLDELAYYCRKDNPVGAVVLFGESGCGKTYLIDRQLQEALKDTHYIIRVSLFGISSIAAMHEAVKRQWLCTLSPFLSTISRDPDKMEKGKSIMEAVTSILRLVDPKIGKVTDAMRNALDYVVITPEVEDLHTKTKKRVVLVFDDIDRTKLNMTELLGSINDYCENKQFNTIIVANLNLISEKDPVAADLVKSAREKTIAYSVLNCPDYGGIVRNVITGRTWKTEEYAAFLKSSEDTVIELFGTDPSDTETGEVILAKTHNIRSLITGLESFFRIYYHMKKAGVQELEGYFCSFLAYYLVEKSGVFRDGEISYSFTDDDIIRLYPRFSADCLFESSRKWISVGYWNRSLFARELSQAVSADLSDLADSGEDELG